MSPELMPHEVAAPGWQPPTTHGAEGFVPGNWVKVAPRWSLPEWLPRLHLVEWPLLEELRETHEAAQAAYTNASGAYHRGKGELGEAVAALRELRSVAEAAIAALRAPGATQPAHESYARERERLTLPTGEAAGSGMAPVLLSEENKRATAEAEAQRAFYAKHAEEREKLRADFEALCTVCSPAFRVSTPPHIAELLDEVDEAASEVPTGSRAEGEPAP